MKFKNVLLTSAVASLSLIGLVSCGGDDSVKIKDANGNTITIKKTDDTEQVAQALGAIGVNSKETISKFGVKLSNELNLSLQYNNETATIESKNSGSVELDFNGLTYKKIDAEEELSDADKETINKAINDTKLYAEVSGNGDVALNSDTLKYNASVKAYKTAGSESALYLDFGECKAEIAAQETSTLFGVYNDIKGISAFSGDKYKILTSTIASNADEDDLVSANNALYEIQTNVGMLNVNTISKYASESSVDLKALVEQFGIEISNVSGHTVEFKASMKSSAFASIVNLISDDFKLENTNSVYSLTLSADATTGFIKSLAIDFSNIKGSYTDEGDTFKFNASKLTASIEFKYNDEVIEKTAPDATYKTALEFYDKYNKNFGETDK